MGLRRLRFTLHAPPVSRAQKNLFMQNKPNFPNAQMNVCSAITMDYVNIRLRSHRQNKAKQTQFKANLSQFQCQTNPRLILINSLDPAAVKF